MADSDEAPVGAGGLTPDRVKAFWRSRTAVEGPRAARFHSDHDPYDLAAIAELAQGAERLLDLGCGMCVIPNLIVDRLGIPVHGVDYIPEFLEAAIDDPRMTTEAGDVRTYAGHGERYDGVINLGVITYLLEAEERRGFYERCRGLLKPGGWLFTKAQLGVRETVTVDHFSEDLGGDYVAVYPQIDAEMALMGEVLADVRAVDPYPPEFSRYDNTHFHYLIARAPAT